MDPVTRRHFRAPPSRVELHSGWSCLLQLYHPCPRWYRWNLSQPLYILSRQRWLPLEVHGWAPREPWKV